jgi:hypothetical protein
MPARRARHAGIDKRVTPEGLRNSGRVSLPAGPGARAVLVPDADLTGFRERYPAAARKWEDAAHLFVANPRRHATRIGHDCREALLFFADEVARRHGISQRDSGGTVSTLRAVVAARDVGGKTVESFLSALLGYWRAVSDLAQRQEHAARRENETLRVEDARRLVSQTLIVMYEVDRALTA